MRKLVTAILLIGALACKEKKAIPNVDKIAVNLSVERFEQDFFKLDTTRPQAAIDSLQKKYPAFINDYLYNILGSIPQKDSVIKNILLFKQGYKEVYYESQRQYASFAAVEKQVKQSFQFIHYYFPGYKLPTALITFIGPFDGIASALTSSGMAIGLQSYLGKDYPAYQSEYISQVYPAYKSRTFAEPFIAVNCVKNIIEDIYPDKSLGRPLIERIIEAGKRAYLLDAFMPYTADTLKNSYTKKQYEDCLNNERNIWTFFVQNNLLYETEPSQIAIYVTEGPGTPELSNTAPGFIGQFTGLQIVKKWMEKNKNKTLPDLLQTPAQQIFNEAKYKP